MGWLWSSSPKPAAGAQEAPPPDSTQSRLALSDEQRARIFGPDTVEPKSSSVPPTREEQADSELEAFLQSFSGPSATGEAGTSASGQPQTAPPPPVNLERLLEDGTPNISPSALQPRTMSCRQAFDQAFYCQSLGGKFNDLYRFGQVKDCSEQWGAFWFCMRTRTYPDKEKENHIREYYEERDERRKKEYGSSERIWDIREKAVERAFWKDPDATEEEGERKEMMVKG